MRFALPINFDKIGIRNAAVFPEPNRVILVKIFLKKKLLEDNLKHTSLCTRKNIMPFKNSWNTVSLNRSGYFIPRKYGLEFFKNGKGKGKGKNLPCQSDVFQHHWMKFSPIELFKSQVNSCSKEELTLEAQRDWILKGFVK
jgi:hypothetical protein